MKEIFRNFQDAQEPVEDISDGDMKILKYAFNLAKSVPRQSNRCKWRAKSGYMPDMLQQSSSNSGKLFAGDIVFFQSLDNRLINLVVTEDTILSDLDMSLKVKMLQSEELNRIYSIKLAQLFKDSGQTVVIPSTLFKFEDGEARRECIICF